MEREMDESKQRDFQRFVKHLHDSREGVVSAANWLNSLGYSVTMPPSTVSDSYENRMDHVDNGDLYINMRVEVKRLGIEFTSKEDWKFGDKFIVCAKHSFDNAKPKPYAYIIQSLNLTHIAVVNSSTCKQKRKDSRYEDMTQNFYLCPIDLVRFHAV
jgi:hypothetical protein